MGSVIPWERVGKYQPYPVLTFFSDQLHSIFIYYHCWVFFTINWTVSLSDPFSKISNNDTQKEKETIHSNLVSVYMQFNAAAGALFNNIESFSHEIK